MSKMDGHPNMERRWTVIRIWDDVEAATAAEAIMLTVTRPHDTAKAKQVPDNPAPTTDKCPKCGHPWSEHDQELIGAGKMMLPEYNPHGYEDLYECNHYMGMGGWCGCEERSRRPLATTP